MFYFKMPKGEEVATLQAATALSHRGLEIEMSSLAIRTLHQVRQAAAPLSDDALKEHNGIVVHSLFRKGFLTRYGQGMNRVRVTRLGEIVLELCDACGLIVEEVEHEGR